MLRSGVVLGAVLALAGCKADSRDVEVAYGATAEQQRPAVVARAEAKPVVAAETHAGGCGDSHVEPVRDGEVRTHQDASGATVTAAGAELSGAPVATVAELLARPEAFAGKTVRLEGNVSAMCVHGRAWFAIQEEGRGGRFVRVLTRPAFLVPEGAIGRFARAEGVIETIEVPADTARHYAKQHQLGDPAAVQGPIMDVVLRAMGAEFI